VAQNPNVSPPEAARETLDNREGKLPGWLANPCHSVHMQHTIIPAIGPVAEWYTQDREVRGPDVVESTQHWWLRAARPGAGLERLLDTHFNRQAFPPNAASCRCCCCEYLNCHPHSEWRSPPSATLKLHPGGPDWPT